MYVDPGLVPMQRVFGCGSVRSEEGRWIEPGPRAVHGLWRSAEPRDVTRTPRAGNRLNLLLDAAAARFASEGFKSASVRDIVRTVGMLPGSLYYHFATKDALLVAVYAEGVRRIEGAVRDAIAGKSDPWGRVEAACIAHLEALLDQSAYAKVVVSVNPLDAPAVMPALIKLRDGYERIFIDLLAALTLPRRCDQHVLRMVLLGALNWTPTWYRKGEKRPHDIARAYVCTC